MRNRHIYPCPRCGNMRNRQLKRGCMKCTPNIYGLSARSLRRLGGMKRLAEMSEEARALMLGLAKRAAA